MRPLSHRALLALAVAGALAVLTAACRTEVGTCAPVLADAPASGARVTAKRDVGGMGSVITVDVKPGAAANLLVALGDRVPELDLTPAPDAPEPVRRKLSDAQPLFVPVGAQESARVRVHARPWHGRDLLEHFVAPLGGEAGATALREAAPDFVKRSMIEVHVEVEVGAKTSSARLPIVATTSEQPNASTAFLRDDEVVGLGEPLRIAEWPMAETGTGFTPAIHQRGTKLVGGTVDGEKPVDQLPAAVWTLWMQLEPAAP